MKLSPAEYRLLDALASVKGEMPVLWLTSTKRYVASYMRGRGLISKRAWNRGYVVATAKGKRSHGYGVR